MELLFILGIPAVLAPASLLIRRRPSTVILNTIGYAGVLAASCSLALRLQAGKPLSHGIFFADALSAFFVFLIALISLVSMLYSAGYISADVKSGAISGFEPRLYYGLFNLFTFTMLFTALINNLGIVWVSIEMTTLVSAFLVGFYNKESSVEAAWKYIIICSVGISFALLGTILFYYAASTQGGSKSLNWTDMIAVAPYLDPRMLKIAFIFILVGYGTKAGFAPMHTWLPDAHSQALSPISALLSGVLLKTALYVILRYVVIVNTCMGPGFTGNLLLLFGVLSLLVSAGFILVQRDIKRLLAYSSIEHMGVICIGLGIGGFLGLYAALFHMLNHAVTKSLMFFGAGSIARKYNTHDLRAISGVLQSMPFTGRCVLLGVFALAGMPPFSIFMSEFLILTAGFTQGRYFASAVLLFVTALIFGALLLHFSRILFGKKPVAMTVTGEDAGSVSAFIILALFIIVLGAGMPLLIHKMLAAAALVVQGVIC